jgi:hypothetical protein
MQATSRDVKYEYAFQDRTKEMGNWIAQEKTKPFTTYSSDRIHSHRPKEEPGKG